MGTDGELPLTGHAPEGDTNIKLLTCLQQLLPGGLLSLGNSLMRPSVGG